MKYLYKKTVDWIFRKKSITYILVIALIREFGAIFLNDALITELQHDTTLQDWYIHYPIIAINFVFGGGNFTVVWILIALIVFFRIFEVIETYINKPMKPKEDFKGQTIINEAPIEKQVNINGTVEELNI